MRNKHHRFDWLTGNASDYIPSAIFIVLIKRTAPPASVPSVEEMYCIGFPILEILLGNLQTQNSECVNHRFDWLTGITSDCIQSAFLIVI